MLLFSILLLGIILLLLFVCKLSIEIDFSKQEITILLMGQKIQCIEIDNIFKAEKRELTNRAKKEAQITNKHSSNSFGLNFYNKVVFWSSLLKKLSTCLTKKFYRLLYQVEFKASCHHFDPYTMVLIYSFFSLINNKNINFFLSSKEEESIKLSFSARFIWYLCTFVKLYLHRRGKRQ